MHKADRIAFYFNLKSIFKLKSKGKLCPQLKHPSNEKNSIKVFTFDSDDVRSHNGIKENWENVSPLERNSLAEDYVLWENFRRFGIDDDMHVEIISDM
jgi:hypothetical protein